MIANVEVVSSGRDCQGGGRGGKSRRRARMPDYVRDEIMKVCVKSILAIANF